MVRPFAAKGAPKALAACASLSESGASHVGGKGLRGQSRVRASNAPVHRHRRGNSTENATAWEPKKPSIKAANSKVGSKN